MFTPEQYASKAAEMWLTFKPNERALVAMAIFPAEQMEAATALGYETHPLVVALMNHQRQQPQPTRRRR